MWILYSFIAFGCVAIITFFYINAYMPLQRFREDKNEFLKNEKDLPLFIIEAAPYSHYRLLKRTKQQRIFFPMASAPFPYYFTYEWMGMYPTKKAAEKDAKHLGLLEEK